MRQAHHVDQMIGAFPKSCDSTARSRPGREGREQAREIKHLPGRDQILFRRHRREDHRLLEAAQHLAFMRNAVHRPTGDIDTVEMDRACIGLLQAGHTIEEGRLGGTVGTHETAEFTLPDIEVDAAHCLHRAIAFTKATNGENLLAKVRIQRGHLRAPVSIARPRSMSGVRPLGSQNTSSSSTRPYITMRYSGEMRSASETATKTMLPTTTPRIEPAPPPSTMIRIVVE